MLCRHEYQSQQPLRAATLQHVTKIKAKTPGFGSYWVASPPPHTHCYLISKSSQGSLFLLDPRHEQALPRQLALKPRASYHAFALPDGRLRLVELASDKLLTLSDPFEWDAIGLAWHILDPATGHMVASEQKHIWPVPSPKPHQIYHERSGKVLGLVNVSTLAIMDAETLHEAVQCDISPHHAGLKTRGTSTLEKVAWSPSGSMLAVAVRSNPQELRDMDRDWYTGLVAGSAMLAEVHIYDTATGRCLQSVPMQASDIKLQWSPGTDQLAVYTCRELWDELEEGDWTTGWTSASAHQQSRSRH